VLAFWHVSLIRGDTGSTKDEKNLLERITVDGEAITRNARIRVEEIVERMAAGDSVESILQVYPESNVTAFGLSRLRPPNDG
jgi:hypothetical protein